MKVSIDRDQKYREMAGRGKYRALYSHLRALSAQEWRTGFSEVESVLGFTLPPSARLHRPWWANPRRASGHSHALAWTIAGWETAEVDVEAETLVFRRKGPRPAPKPSLDEIWPVHPTARWPKGLSLRREDLYEDRA